MADSKITTIGEGQLVTFRLAGEELAVPIEIVQEIIRLPQLTKVPNTPPYVEGIGNLRGNILPVVNLRRRLELEPKPSDDATRVIVLNVGGVVTGLIVDSVSEVLHIDSDVLEAPPRAIAGIDGQYLENIAKLDKGKRLVLIINAMRILPEVSRKTQTGSLENTAKADTHQREKTALEEEEHVVTFKVGNEEYAIDIMQVQEIIRVPTITQVPKAPSFVRGVIALRNRLLPILSLRAIFGMEEATATSNPRGDGKEEDRDTRRIIVIDLGGVATGIQVDSVSEVLTLPMSKIEPPPPIVRGDNVSRLRGVGKLNNGERLLMLLDVSKLVNAETKKDLAELGGGETMAKETQTRAKEQIEEIQVVCFRLQDEEFGINIMRVQEIIRVSEITAVPRSPHFVEGIVNLRGNVLPVIDLRKRFGVPPAARTEQNRIVVVDIAGKITGIIVDSVSEVLRVAKNQIEPPPSVVAGIEGQYIEGVAKLKNGERIVILVNVDAILNAEETKEYRKAG